MIFLELSAIAKLAFVWIINPKVWLHSEPNIRFDWSYSSIFIINFVRLELIFKFFFSRIDKP